MIKRKVVNLMTISKEYLVDTLKKEKNIKDSVADVLYNLVINIKLERSMDDIKNGRVMTLEESRERMRKKYASYNH